MGTALITLNRGRKGDGAAAPGRVLNLLGYSSRSRSLIPRPATPPALSTYPRTLNSPYLRRSSPSAIASCRN